MDYLLHLVILIGLYAILTASLDLLSGQLGLVSVSQAAFWGIGAYASAVLTVSGQAGFFGAMLIGMLMAAILSMLVSLPSTQLSGDYFVVASLGFQLILFDVFNNWISLTKGPFGIGAIPAPMILGFEISTRHSFAILVVVFAVLAYLLVALIIKSPFGRVLRALREDELLVKAVGKNATKHKIITFAISAMLAAFSGSLFAHYSTYIEPNNFRLADSIMIVSMVIIGGSGSLWGPFVGAAVLVLLPEGLRFMGLSTNVAANMRQIMYGLLLVLMMMFRPKGLLGRDEY